MGNQKDQATTENQRDQKTARDAGNTNRNQTPDAKDGLYPKQAPAKGADTDETYDESQHDGKDHETVNQNPNDPSRVDRTGTPEKENDPTRIRREANDPSKVDPTRITNK